MRLMGIALIVVGVIWAALAWNMKTVVETSSSSFGEIHVPSQKVNNLGLLESKRNHLMLASVVSIAGVIFFGFGTLSSRSMKDAEKSNLTNMSDAASDLPPLYLEKNAGEPINDEIQQAEAALRVAEISIQRSGSKWELRDKNGSVSYVWNKNDLIAIAKVRGVSSS